MADSSRPHCSDMIAGHSGSDTSVAFHAYHPSSCCDSTANLCCIDVMLLVHSRCCSRCHVLGSYKDETEGMFEEGQRLYGEQRFSEAAERWGRAALLQHAPSHAHVSDMLIEGRAGVAKDKKRAFAFASAGAALGCAHSKGVLSRCYLFGHGVAEDDKRGLVLRRESEAAGSCFGQFVVGGCYKRR